DEPLHQTSERRRNLPHDMHPAGLQGGFVIELHKSWFLVGSGWSNANRVVVVGVGIADLDVARRQEHGRQVGILKQAFPQLPGRVWARVAKEEERRLERRKRVATYETAIGGWKCEPDPLLKRVNHCLVVVSDDSPVRRVPPPVIVLVQRFPEKRWNL